MKYLSGVYEIDKALGGGFASGSLVLIFAEGELSGKTTTLSYLANQSIQVGNEIGFISFDDDIESVKKKVPHFRATKISLADEPKAKFSAVERLLSGLSSELVFIDNLTKVDGFMFHSEAVSVVHNLRTIAMYTSKAIVATIGVFNDQDIVPLIRIADVVFDIEDYQNNAFSLGVLKNRHGQAGFNINFGVAH